MDLNLWMQFSRWLIEHQHLLDNILFAYEATLNFRFSVNTCGVELLKDQLVEAFVLKGHLAGEIYHRFFQELILLMENVPLRNRVTLIGR